MRVARTRQPAALPLVVAIMVMFAFDGWSAPAVDEVASELAALQLQQAALGDPTAAREEWRQLEAGYTALVSREPARADVRLSRGDLLWQMGERARAMADWREAQRLDPQSAAPLLRLGEGALTLGHAKDALTAFHRGLELAPDNSHLHFSFANVCFLFRHELHDDAHPTSESRLLEALDHFATASRLAPQNADYARAYAETFYNLAAPDWNAALDAWRKVEALSEKPDFALLNVARVQLRLRQPDAAMASLEKVQEASHERLKGVLTRQALEQKASNPAP